ncbi:MAG TPA: tRNA lysidine(34) synthetase TilS [Syntrophales bacterium]|nr:tRNA lysidine(34) synthetase TilS [Syntrophales bacterium]
MLRRGDHVLVGLSGGADSVALLAVLNRLRPLYGLALSAAHFNHKMRGTESDADEVFVRALCKSLGIALVCRSLEERTRPRGVSVEDFLRRHRYAFFERTRQETGASRVALGHHQDDQAETVLMNIIRGAGLAGLSGIPPVRSDTFIRPLIDCSRREILDFLESEGLSFVDDSTNTDERFLRNRIRIGLMPELESRFNPAIGETLCRLADVIREENDYISRNAQDHVARWRGDDVPKHPFQVPVPDLRGLHLALQRRVILEIARGVSAVESAIGFEHVQAVLDLAAGAKPSGCLDLPGGLLVARNYGLLEFRRAEKSGVRHRSERAPKDPGEAFTLEVCIPGTVRIASLGMSIRFRELKRVPAVTATAGRAYLDRDRIAFPLVVRSIKPGDRIQPLGMKGTRKLKSVFIDDKIPRALRGTFPVLADTRSVLWVPGVRLSERVRIGEATKRVLSAEII